MRSEILMAILAMLFIPALAIAEDAETPEDSGQALVATECCLDYQEVCIAVTCHEECMDWGKRCLTDCGERCQWNCSEWGYGCYECCELLAEVECESDEEGPSNCLNRFSATNCTECCDEYECIGGWNQTCEDKCVTECHDVCLVRGEVCECAEKAWRCNRWGPCRVPEERVARGLNDTEPEDALETALEENGPSEVSNDTTELEPPNISDATCEEYPVVILPE